ncbi:inositol 5-phosphatase [Cryomyces antarcticus]
MAPLTLYILTYNCARGPIHPASFASTLFAALPSADSTSRAPHILVLSLQEIAPVAPAFLGGSFLTPYFDAFAAAVEGAAAELGAGYVDVATRNVGMTGLMVFVRADVVGRVRAVAEGGVGTGLWAMGNKGAVGVRLRIGVDEEGPGEGEEEGEGEVEVAFVAAHLAPMEDQVERRNADWRNIVRNLVFTPTTRRPARLSARRPTSAATSSSEEENEQEPLLRPTTPAGPNLPPAEPSSLYTPPTYLFLAGDLNYRTASTKPAPSASRTFPQPTKDPSDPLHYSQLLASDQLTRERNAGRTLHGLVEAPVRFPPTYKYHHGEGGGGETAVGNADAVGDAEALGKWDWAPHRWPSWCDRILYLDSSTASVQPHTYTALPLQRTSDHRPVALAVSIPSKPLSSKMKAPFPLNPHWKADRAAARQRELVVGVLAWLGLTWEGRAAVLVALVGSLGGWAVLRSLIAF